MDEIKATSVGKPNDGRKIEPKGKLQVRKKPEPANIAWNFIVDFYKDVLDQPIKKAIRDIVIDGIDMVLYGEVKGRSKSRADYVSYNKFSDRDRRDDRRSSVSYSRNAYDDATFEHKDEAKKAIDTMNEIIGMYGVVKVADLYELANRDCPWTAHRYGWTSIRGAEPTRGRDGWYIRLPKAMPID